MSIEKQCDIGIGFFIIFLFLSDRANHLSRKYFPQTENKKPPEGGLIPSFNQRADDGLI